LRPADAATGNYEAVLNDLDGGKGLAKLRQADPERQQGMVKVAEEIGLPVNWLAELGATRSNFDAGESLTTLKYILLKVRGKEKAMKVIRAGIVATTLRRSSEIRRSKRCGDVAAARKSATEAVAACRYISDSDRTRIAPVGRFGRLPQI
jgi:hypothetical protein